MIDYFFLDDMDGTASYDRFNGCSVEGCYGPGIIVIVETEPDTEGRFIGRFVCLQHLEELRRPKPQQTFDFFKGAWVEDTSNT